MQTGDTGRRCLEWQSWGPKLLLPSLLGALVPPASHCPPVFQVTGHHSQGSSFPDFRELPHQVLHQERWPAKLQKVQV